ncbi:MAG: 2-amino-4-hydroxy-6-hydroxymethyldihydropteridine diphosphokinase [Salibacteraceae bacterium]
MSLAVVSLGSNMGDWKAIFLNAFSHFKMLGRIDEKSSVFKTEPWGVQDQPWFKNQVVGLKTDLPPRVLMSELLKVEELNGRDRSRETRWGQRTLDLDILFFENQTINTQDLIIPHPRMHLRNFIMDPLCEIYPQLFHTVLKKKMVELKHECTDLTKTEKF